MDLQRANEAPPPGPSTLTLARIALGCGNFGGVGSAPAFFGQGLDEDDALTLMDAAWELGITHFDTADAYGGGRSEHAIGRWIATRGVHPTLTTKTFNPMSEGGDSGLAPARITRQLHDSLERLGVDRVELYLAHEFDPETPVDEWTEALQEHQRAGRIGGYGVSNFDAEQLTQALAVGDPVAVQNEYSLLRRGDEAELLPLCAERHVAYAVYSPLCGGWLTGKYSSRSAVPGRVADDAAARAVRGAGVRGDVRQARRARPVRRAAWNLDGRRGARVAAGRRADRADRDRAGAAGASAAGRGGDRAPAHRGRARPSRASVFG